MLKKILFTVFGLLALNASALLADENAHVINYTVSLSCPTSHERSALESNVPSSVSQASSQEEWAKTTVTQLEDLIALVKSGNYTKANATFDIGEQ